MNIELLQEKLLRAARAHAPSESVPYAFEKRVLARIQSVSIVDSLTLWVRALWRAAIPCCAIVVLLFAWGVASSSESAPTETSDLGSHLETTLMASIPVDNELSW